MYKKEIFEKLVYEMDVELSYKEFKNAYNSLVKEAIWEMKENSLIDEPDHDLPDLYVQIGLYENDLIGRCEWRKNSYGETSEFYYGFLIDIVDRDEYTPSSAHDWLCDDDYYQRTGNISERVKKEYWDGYGDSCLNSIKDFETVLDELIEHLENEKENDFTR